mmetsp:Transcript_13559/g.24193  ORF Transcript_13559/g.24193 Transcript_13559/m.24193 type:complete len:242 (+) Transcript_13559:60-785(+)
MAPRSQPVSPFGNDLVQDDASMLSHSATPKRSRSAASSMKSQQGSLNHPRQPHKSRSVPAVISPGPGYYSPAHGYLPPGRTIPRTQRWQKEDDFITPGPAYYLKAGCHPGFRKFASQPKFSDVPRKFGAHRSSMLAGPGDYDPQCPSTGQPLGSFSRSKRWPSSKLHANPGPADYRTTRAANMRFRKTPGQPAFSVVARHTLVRHSGVTGPPRATSAHRSPSRGPSRGPSRSPSRGFQLDF